MDILFQYKCLVRIKVERQLRKTGLQEQNNSIWCLEVCALQPDGNSLGRRENRSVAPCRSAHRVVQLADALVTLSNPSFQTAW